MKVGDYVRTKYGITQIKENVCLLDEVIKSSPNIIDLIEVGDYVNGYKVGCIDDCKGAMRQFHYDDENPNDDVGHWEEEIETIVTKEQFESMEYKIGE